MNLLKKFFYAFDSFRSYNIFDRPIFIISAPRSGSTLLYDLLCKFEGVYGYSVETDDVWWAIFPRDRLFDGSDRVTAEECTPDKICAFRRFLYRMIIWDLEKRGRRVSLVEKLGLKKIRYIEKTIANCFHLDAILKIFPDSCFIWLIRDPRAIYSSMLVGWKGSKRAQIFDKLDPLKKEFDLELFPYPLPPNWKENMVGKTEAIAFAWALSQYIEIPMYFFSSLPNSRKIIIRYEDFIKDPSRLLSNIAEKYNFTLPSNFKKFLNKLPLSRTTVTKPIHNKWKILHGHVIDSPDIKPIIYSLVDKLGYV